MIPIEKNREARKSGRERERGLEGGETYAEGASASATRAHLFTSIDREGWGSMAERPWIRLPMWKGLKGCAGARWWQRGLSRSGGKHESSLTGKEA